MFFLTLSQAIPLHLWLLNLGMRPELLHSLAQGNAAAITLNASFIFHPAIKSNTTPLNWPFGPH